jgi:magnesium transporter
MMLKAIKCNTQEHTFQRVTSIEQASTVKDIPDAVLWLDLQSPPQQELDKLRQEFHLHPLAIEDASHEHQRPKVEEYENFYFVVFYAVHLKEDRTGLDVAELDMFLGQNYLVTIHYQPVPELDEAERRWTRNVKQLEWGVGVLLYSLLDTLVDGYFPVVDELADRIEELEDSLFSRSERQNVITQKLLELKKDFLPLRRIVTPERDVMNNLTNRDSPIFEKHTLVYFRDIYDHISRLTDALDLYRDQLSTTMDANLSIISNDLNVVMRTLTSASIILMVDSLLAGIWGMNFEFIPELHLRYGYFGALTLMALTSIILLFVFKRLKWL